jgi:hypothetical protein
MRSRSSGIVALGLLAAACSSSLTAEPTGGEVPTRAPTFAPAATPLVTVAPSPAALAPPSAASVAFWTALSGLLVGTGSDGSGEVWSTGDGGETWTASAPGLPALWSVSVAAGGYAWAIASCPHTGPAIGCSIFASTDNATTWSKVSDQSFSAISFVDASHGWGVLDDGPTVGGNVGSGVWRTVDGGRTWQAMKTPPCRSIGAPVGVSFVSARHGWVGCQNVYGAGSADKGIVETADGGTTWKVRSATAFGTRPVGSISESDYLADISMRPSGAGLAWEQRGGTLRTTDGGATWREIPPGGSDAGPIPYGGSTATDHDWFVVLWDGNLQATALWASHDSGLHWRSVAAVPPLP